MKTTYISSIIVGSTLSGLLTSSAQNLLLNGSFEDPIIAANTLSLSLPSSWSGANAPALINGTYGVPGYPGPEQGNQYAGLGNAGGGAASLWQTFNVGVAGDYVLTWYKGTTDDLGSTSPYTTGLVGPGGTVVDESYVIHAGTAGWSLRSVPVNLVPGDYTLTFASQQAPFGVALFLDNVSVAGASTSVPEGGASAMYLALGLAGLMTVRRWRSPQKSGFAH